ncbi:MAG: hypothetical protein Q7S06_00870 [Nanoarchaeota archaeon]|nr:hypothetical protein [Nanoarchaeota archaeon]
MTKDTMKRPGGKFFGEETVLSPLIKELNLSVSASQLCRDKDFVNAFVQAIPNKKEQEKYLINTSRYEDGEDFDSRYVLFFRRTLPSRTPTYEEHWTNVYMQARKGLTVEIPEGPQRLHTIIVCDSLDRLQPYQKKEEVRAFTDGEIVVNLPKYDQSKSLLRFKPENEKEELSEYLKKKGALTPQQLRDQIERNKSKQRGDSQSGGLEKTVSIILFLSGIFFLSNNMTGNAIINLSNKTSSFLGVGLLVTGLIIGLFWIKHKK